MEIHYGPSNIPDPELVFRGNQGPETAIYIRAGYFGGQAGLQYGGTILGDPADPELFIITAGEGLNYNLPDSPGLSSIPESGRVHRLDPAAPVGVLNASTRKFSIYPTMVQNKIWVTDAVNPNAAYRITDITGKQVKTGSLSGNNPVNVSNLKAGLYIFSIDGMANAVKFVKE